MSSLEAPANSASYAAYNTPEPSVSRAAPSITPGTEGVPGSYGAPVAGTGEGANALDQHMDQKKKSRRHCCCCAALIALITIIVLAAIFIPLGLTVFQPSPSGDPSTNKSAANGTQTTSTEAALPVGSGIGNSPTVLYPSSTATGAPHSPVVTTPPTTTPTQTMGGGIRGADVTNVNIQLPMPIRGVNMGGWLVQEAWIVPSLFDYCVNKTGKSPVDEFTLTQYLGKDGATSLLQPHWDSWVQESDIQNLANTGLNLLRIPVPHYMISIIDSEPYVNGASTNEEAMSGQEGTMLFYLNRALKWAQKYNLACIIDIHTMPGSQNGFDNSGQSGAIHFTDPDNIARGLQVVANITKLVTSDPSLAGTIVGIEVVNEPFTAIPIDQLDSFYANAYQLIRNTTTNPPSLAQNLWVWLDDGYRPGSNLYQFAQAPYTRVMYDAHVYEIFAEFFYEYTMEKRVDFICQTELDAFGSVPQAVGTGANFSIPTVVGEFSIALSDCTPHINGYNTLNRMNGSFAGSRAGGYGAPLCGGYNSNTFADMTDADKEVLKQYNDAQMSVYESAGGWSFWNFKTEYHYPQWDWLAAVENGIIPQPLGQFKYPCKNTYQWSNGTLAL